MDTIFPLKHSRRVYCAGPLFNEAERHQMQRIASALQDAGFETFLPHADGMEFTQIQPILISRGYDQAQAGQFLHAAIFAMDIYQVVLGCGSLVFNMNGRVPDEGAVAETSIAWTLGKPIVLFKEDARSMIQSRDNPLLVGQTDFQTITQLEQIPQALSNTIANHPLDKTYQATCPPQLMRNLQSGKKLWQQLETIDVKQSAEKVADVVVEQFSGGVEKVVEGSWC